MEANRAEQLEALQTLTEFNEKVVKNIHILIKELKGERLDDTDKFQQSIISAINWEIQVLNGTMDVLNEGGTRVDKEAVNKKIVALGEVLKTKEDIKVAEAFEELLPGVREYRNRCKGSACIRIAVDEPLQTWTTVMAYCVSADVRG